MFGKRFYTYSQTNELMKIKTKLHTCREYIEYIDIGKKQSFKLNSLLQPHKQRKRVNNKQMVQKPTRLSQTHTSFLH